MNTYWPGPNLLHCAVIATLLIGGGVPSAVAKTIQFSGMTWNVRPAESGGPGPNAWSDRNVFADASGKLHLQIRYRNGKWTCAQVSTRRALGFGRYQWFVTGRLDRLDRNVVLGMFQYGGVDGQNEIDIEMSRWSKPSGPDSRFTVYPAQAKLGYKTKAFDFSLNGAYTTHRFDWQSKSILFQMLDGHRDDDRNLVSAWTVAPRNYLQAIPQKPMPTYINLWLDHGKPPADNRPVEIVIARFKYSRQPQPKSGTPS
ncbi:MAG TPA: glycoside hydrolase family 16 protein [Alphaproteobacteria bacterium]|jgi:hypothetical protein|nr:glycoside hydrolase family 16 protein [Alphaproteobacteria bacterium]